MSESNNVRGTAFIIAEFRAEENEEAAPLYTDEVVKFFLNGGTKETANHVAQNFPAAKEMIKIDKYESLYAPWITGFENIEPLAKSLNLKVIENYSTADLHNKYRPERSLESNIFKFYFVCTLEKS